MTLHPRVTVFIPVKDRQSYIGDAIRSVLAQTFTDFELLVIDDASTDATADVVRSFADSRIILVQHETNQGIPRTRNHALTLARGEYLANLDSDDQCHPARLERQVAFMEAHLDHAVVGSWGRDIDATGALMRRIRREPLRCADADVHLLFRCAVRNRSAMLRTAIAREYRYNEDFTLSQDYELHARLAQQYCIANLPSVLVYGRQHGGRITKMTSQTARALKMRIMDKGLRNLGLDPDAADLAGHFDLYRPAGRQGGVSDAYLDWARGWLMDLRQANAHTGRYEPKALDRALAGIWTKLCWHASRSQGRKAPAWLPRFEGWYKVGGNLAVFAPWPRY